MVVFLDLDDDVSDPHADPSQPPVFALPRCLPSHTSVTAKNNLDIKDDTEHERPNPNISTFSAALGCYPIVTALAHYIDLNTLHALSRTGRQIRANLLQYRNRLVQQTLRCGNESRDPSLSLKETGLSGQKWHILGEAGHLVSGKVSTCARDLVSDCRRCGRIVCRNCTLKPPARSHLPSRHRRLCSTCLAAPLSLLVRNNASPPTPCICPSVIHLCAPCGASLATADRTYHRVWTWRTRYSTYLGGLGTGVGEGNEGVKCARGEDCLGAKDVVVEFECGSTPTPSLSHGSSSSSSSSGRAGSDGGDGEGSESPWTEKDEAGYWRQEIEGLGGIVKKKFRKREKVGGTVKEWEDEREGSEEVLGREKEGRERSWCGWCGRVVLGEAELEEITGETLKNKT